MTRNPELSQALQELIELTRNSRDDGWAGRPAAQLSKRLKGISARLDRRFTFARLQLRFSLIPTGPLQELAISNGWGQRFVELAQTIESHLR